MHRLWAECRVCRVATVVCNWVQEVRLMTESLELWVRLAVQDTSGSRKQFLTR